MNNIRKGLQYALIGIGFVIFRRTDNFPLKFSLFIVLVSLIIQEFLHIFNSEIKKSEIPFLNKVNHNYFLKIAFIIVLELLLIGALYYLSFELWKNFRL